MKRANGPEGLSRGISTSSRPVTRGLPKCGSSSTSGCEATGGRSRTTGLRNASCREIRGGLAARGTVLNVENRRSRLAAREKDRKEEMCSHALVWGSDFD